MLGDPGEKREKEDAKPQRKKAENQNYEKPRIIDPEQIAGGRKTLRVI